MNKGQGTHRATGAATTRIGAGILNTVLEPLQSECWLKQIWMSRNCNSTSECQDNFMIIRYYFNYSCQQVKKLLLERGDIITVNELLSTWIVYIVYIKSKVTWDKDEHWDLDLSADRFRDFQLQALQMCWFVHLWMSVWTHSAWNTCKQLLIIVM